MTTVQQYRALCATISAHLHRHQSASVRHHISAIAIGSGKAEESGEIAAADRIAMEKRAVCQREARAKKLSFMQRRTYVKSCVKR
ncbi:MAG: hypothetical protein WA706_03585 [Pseudolabrys sp.]